MCDPSKRRREGIIATVTAVKFNVLRTYFTIHIMRRMRTHYYNIQKTYEGAQYMCVGVRVCARARAQPKPYNLRVYSLKTIETNLIFQFIVYNIRDACVHYAVYHTKEVHIMYCVCLQRPLCTRTTASEYPAKEIIFISSWCFR